MNIYYLANFISEDEITQQKELIFKILANELHAPQVKRLNGITFHSQPVFRAKIDKKNRLIFMRIMQGGKPALLILNQNDHNYDELARKLSGANIHKIKSFDFEAAPAVVLPSQPEEGFLPVTVHQEQIFFLDEEQQKATTYSAPLLMSGPPGAGKTLVIYDLLHLYLNNNKIAHWVNEELGHGKKVLFVSQSANLIKKIQQQYAHEITTHIPVDFFTLEQLLLAEQEGSTLVPKDAFSKWLKNVFPQGDPEIIHYELSLVAALSAEEYLKLGKRECYLSGKTKEQQRVINLLNQWRNHVQTKHWIDPLTTEFTITGYGAIFCDETQNFSPLELAALVRAVYKSRQFFANFDDEQAFFSSPYARGCLLRLLTKHFKDYHALHLKKTWRCAARIAEVASHLLSMKHKWDGNQAKREYNILESHLPPESGLVQIVDSEAIKTLKPRGYLAETAILVLSPPDDEERAKIQATTGSSNILTPGEAIGLDFNTIILWKPIATQKILHKISAETRGLNLNEWKMLTQLYVAITRARQELFIYEPECQRYNKQLLLFFGTLQQKNIIPSELFVDEHNERKWLEQVDYHLEKKQFAAATAILKNHLNYDEEAIKLRVNPPETPIIEALPTPKAEPPTERVTKTRNRKKNTNYQMKGDCPKPAPSSSPPDATKSKFINPKPKPIKDLLPELFKNIDQHQEIIFLQYLGHRDKEVRQEFNNALEKNWALINPEQLFFCLTSNEDKLYQAAQTEEGRWIISKLFLESLSDKQQMFIMQAMLPTKKENNSGNYDTAFLAFCRSKDGCQALHNFFIRNPKLLTLFEAWHLDTPNRLYYPTTPLRELVKTNTGRFVLEHFSSLNIIKDLQHHNLYNNIESGLGAIMPPVYHLIQTESGLKILEQFYKVNPSLADRSHNNGPPIYFYFDYLLRIIPKANVKNISPFFTLCVTSTGREFIKSWYLENLEHAALSTHLVSDFVATFTTLIPKEYKHLANTACIHFLCIDDAGQKILSIIKNKYHIDTKLKLLLLKRAGLEVPDIGGATPLQILSKTELGISLIYTWDFIHTEDFARMITGSDFAETLNDKYAPLFDNLCKTKEGREILYSWIQFNPKIVAKLSLDNSFAIGNLYNTPEGAKVVDLLKDTPVYKELNQRGAQVRANIETLSSTFFKSVNPVNQEEKLDSERGWSADSTPQYKD